MALIARPYQADAIDQIRQKMAEGQRRVLLHMATGGGKTFIFSYVISNARAKGRRVLLAVRGRALVRNASHRLLEHDVPHGVLMAGHWLKAPKEPVQVCSIDTLYARRKKGSLPPADLIVIDEAHQAQCESYQWFIDQYPEAYFLSVSATPHVKKGLRHLAETVVYPITVRQLIEQGYLVSPKYFAPSKPDLTDVRVDKKTGDYQLSDLAAAMAPTTLSGDLIRHYKAYADGRPALAFAVSIAHSQEIAAQFQSVGIPSAHMDLHSSDDERAALLERLKSGDIRVIANVGVLGTGVDMPYVSAIIMARPTKSYNLFIQQIGRGTRPYVGKKDFIVLDHAGNIDEHGFIEYERECNLDGEPAKARGERGPVTCKECYFVWIPGEDEKPPHICPECGAIPSVASAIKKPPAIDTTAVLVQKDPHEVFSNKLESLINKAIKHRYKPGWVFHKLKDKYGETAAKTFWRTIKRRVPQ